MTSKYFYLLKSKNSNDVNGGNRQKLQYYINLKEHSSDYLNLKGRNRP